MMHWEKSRRRVCWSVILSSSEVIFFLMSSIWRAKKIGGNGGRPNGLTKESETSSELNKDIGCSLVGRMIVENDAMEVESKHAKGGL
jgi:hypothetical protein